MTGQDVFYLSLAGIAGYVVYRVVQSPRKERLKTENPVEAIANAVFSTPDSSIGSDSYDTDQKVWSWLTGKPTADSWLNAAVQHRKDPKGIQHLIEVQRDGKTARIVSTWSEATGNWVRQGKPLMLPTTGWQSWPLRQAAR